MKTAENKNKGEAKVVLKDTTLRGKTIAGPGFIGRLAENVPSPKELKEIGPDGISEFALLAATVGIKVTVGGEAPVSPWDEEEDDKKK